MTSATSARRMPLKALVSAFFLRQHQAYIVHSLPRSGFVKPLCVRRGGYQLGRHSTAVSAMSTTGRQTNDGGERQPGLEYEMGPKPEVIRDGYKGADKLKGKVAIITGGDSGIGRAVAVHFAREGAAAVTIAYLDEHKDAEETKKMVEEEGAKVVLIPGDIGDRDQCRKIVDETMSTFGNIDILVNNAAEQHVVEDLLEMDMEVMEKTFRTNVFSMFYLTQLVLKHMKDNSCIINTTSVTAYRGSKNKLDYSSTKGAIVSFTRSLSQQAQLIKKNIRVNAVAPGPIWTPLIPATFPDEQVKEFGKQSGIGRSGQPSEIAPAYVFLASEDGSYFTGQVLHPNGGSVVNT